MEIELHDGFIYRRAQTSEDAKCQIHGEILPSRSLDFVRDKMFVPDRRNPPLPPVNITNEEWEMGPFCVLGLTFEEPSSISNSSKLATYLCWRTKCINGNEGEGK
jgi:hypothetical protein